MRLVQKQSGLIAWAFIALLVMLIPGWRVRAQRQWKSSVVDILVPPDTQTLEIVNPSQRFGLSSADETAAARRFPDDVAVALARMDKAGLLREFNAAQSPAFLQVPSTPQEKVALRARVEQIRPRLLKMSDDYFARYDELERRFPDSNLVRAQRLRDTMSGTLNIDEKTAWPPSLSVSSPAPDYALQASVWLSPQGYAAALRTAREGGHMEPDNAFFPWMEAVLEFGARRNDNALRALERAGRCSHFNDYGLKTVASRLDVLRRLRATGWEDDFTEFILIPFPHFAKMRSAARAGIGQMRIARSRGDRERGFRFAAAMSRAGSVVARSDENSLICSLVGRAIYAITWRGAVEDEPGAPKAISVPDVDEAHRQARLQAHRKYDADTFAAMARAHGQNDLAREVETTFRDLDLEGLSQAITSSPVAIPAHIERLAKAYWLASQLLRMALVCAILWSLGWALTRRREEEVTRARASMLIASMFCTGETGALLVAALTLSPSLHGLFELLSDAPSSPELPPSLVLVRDLWWVLVALLWAVLVISGALKTNARPKEVRPAGASTHLKWKIIGASVCVLLPWLLFYSPPSDLTFYCLIIVEGFIAVVASVWSILRTRGEMRVLAVCVVSAFWTGLLGYSLSPGPGDIIVSTHLFNSEPNSISTGPGDLSFYSGFAMLAMAGFTLAALIIGLILGLRKGGNQVASVRAIAFELAVRSRVAAGNARLALRLELLCHRALDSSRRTKNARALRSSTSDRRSGAPARTTQTKSRASITEARDGHSLIQFAFGQGRAA